MQTFLSDKKDCTVRPRWSCAGSSVCVSGNARRSRRRGCRFLMPTATQGQTRPPWSGSSSSKKAPQKAAPHQCAHLFLSTFFFIYAKKKKENQVVGRVFFSFFDAAEAGTFCWLRGRQSKRGGLVDPRRRQEGGAVPAQIFTALAMLWQPHFAPTAAQVKFWGPIFSIGRCQKGTSNKERQPTLILCV